MTETELTRLDVSQFEVSVKDNPNARSRMAVVGLGATGSSFMLLLAHFLKYKEMYDIHLFDFDIIEPHNNQVSMYGFTTSMGIPIENRSKVESSGSILRQLLGRESYPKKTKTGLRGDHNILTHDSKVTMDILEALFGDSILLDYIMVFTDNNESRYEIAQYHEKHPDTTIFDIRVGSYDQFEVYMSKNPSKYNKTIYFEDDGTLTHINTNRVCLDERMHFSIAMCGASLLMNLFTKYVRNELDNVDFRHIMYGRDYIGEVKGY